MLREYSARDVVVTINTGVVALPLTGLSDADDAVMVEFSEDQYGDPDMDMYGNGTHVLNLNKMGTIVLKVKQSAVADLAMLNAIAAAEKPVPMIMGSDLSTMGASFRGDSCALAKTPSWARGKRPGETTWTFKAIRLSVTQAGQRPV